MKNLSKTLLLLLVAISIRTFPMDLNNPNNNNNNKKLTEEMFKKSKNYVQYPKHWALETLPEELKDQIYNGVGETVEVNDYNESLKLHSPIPETLYDLPFHHCQVEIVNFHIIKLTFYYVDSTRSRLNVGFSVEKGTNLKQIHELLRY
jgi:hypothetical protein